MASPPMVTARVPPPCTQGTTVPGASADTREAGVVLDGNVPCLGASGRPGHHPSPERQEVRSCVQTNQRPLRIALVSYRSRPYVGGQGIYLRHLSRELAALGHHVE